MAVYSVQSVTPVHRTLIHYGDQHVIAADHPTINILEALSSADIVRLAVPARGRIMFLMWDISDDTERAELVRFFV